MVCQSRNILYAVPTLIFRAVRFKVVEFFASGGLKQLEKNTTSVVLQVVFRVKSNGFLTVFCKSHGSRAFMQGVTRWRPVTAYHLGVHANTTSTSAKNTT